MIELRFVKREIATDELTPTLRFVTKEIKILQMRQPVPREDNHTVWQLSEWADVPLVEPEDEFYKDVSSS